MKLIVYMYFFTRKLSPISINIVRIHHECEGGIEKSVPRVTVWHHEACRVMTKGDPEGRIFLSHPHTNNGFFFLLTTRYHILYWKNMKRLQENPEFADMRHADVILMSITSQIDVRPTCSRRAAVRFLSFPRLEWECEINRIHHLVFSGDRKISN